MSGNPEQDVIDAIDALVDEQMAGGEIAHRDRARAINTDRCSLCGGAWHGETWTGIDYVHLGEYDQHDHGRAVGCPGASATTGPQRIRWRRRRMRPRAGTMQLVGPGTPYTAADLMAMRSRHGPARGPVVRFWDDDFNLVASTADLENTPDWVTELMEQAIAYCQDQIRAMLGLPGAITLDPATVGELVAEIPLNDGAPAAPAVYVDQVEAIRWGSDEPVRVYARTWLPGDDVDSYFRPIGYVTGDGPRVIDEDGHDLGPWGFDGSRAVLAIEAAPTTTHVQGMLRAIRRWLHL